MLSPAWPWSSSLRNISTPVTVFFCVSRRPTISISSPTLTMPRSTRPVTTVPRPEIEKTSSIGRRKSLSISRCGSGTLVSRAAARSQMGLASARFGLASALATSSYDFDTARPFVDRTFVRAAVKVVLPWSTCPMVPTFTCGFLRSNFSFAIVSSVRSLRVDSLDRNFRDDSLGDRLGNLVVSFELHRVVGAALRQGAELCRVAEHLRQGDARRDHLEVEARLHVVDLSAPRVEVADDVAHELLGRDDLDRHHR